MPIRICRIHLYQLNDLIIFLLKINKQDEESNKFGNITCRHPFDYRGSRILVWGQGPITHSNQCLTTQFGPNPFSSCSDSCRKLDSDFIPKQPSSCYKGIFHQMN